MLNVSYYTQGYLNIVKTEQALAFTLNIALNLLSNANFSEQMLSSVMVSSITKTKDNEDKLEKKIRISIGRAERAKGSINKRFAG